MIKISFDLRQNCNTVLFRINKQEGLERGCGDLFNGKDLEIKSVCRIHLGDDTIFLRGDETECDNWLSIKNFSTFGETKAYKEKVLDTFIAWAKAKGGKFHSYCCTYVIEIPTEHTISIDGKEIKLSNESYEELKKHFKEEK